MELSHKKLVVWQKSIDLVNEIYTLTAEFPSTELFGITSQLRRSAVSIPSNIAEGSARSSNSERRRFLEIARSSLVELDTQLEIALNLQLCLEDDVQSITETMNRMFGLLSGLINRVSP
ncbi:MAG: four helix bundle protein [Gemmatimonadetes bacterium]|nr:four helix bundle protein [Gemmatimonadota bacterium]